MRISGGTICGNCAMGSENILTAPMITIRMAMTIATIGRLMKKRYMRYGRGVEGRRERLQISKLQTPSFRENSNSKLQKNEAWPEHFRYKASPGLALNGVRA